MALYKQDVLDLAALETQLAAAIRAQNTGSALVQINRALYYAQRTCLLRADAMTALAATLADAPTVTPTPTATPTPTPTPTATDQNLMPASQPNGSWVATGRVAKVDMDQDHPGKPVISWNSFFHDYQAQDLALRDGDRNQALPWYMLGRTGNMADANGFGEYPNPSNAGFIPADVNVSNHTNPAGYPIKDAMGGATPGYAYDIEYYGSRQQDQRYTQVDVGNVAANMLSQVLDTSHNFTRRLNFPKVLPAPNGIMRWTWYAATVGGVQSPNADCCAVIIREYAPG